MGHQPRPKAPALTRAGWWATTSRLRCHGVVFGRVQGRSIDQTGCARVPQLRQSSSINVCASRRRCTQTGLPRLSFLHPGVKLEVQISVSADLIEQLNAGRLDVVFAKRPLGTSKGRLVWREPLVWAAADTFDLIPSAALPLALYRERSVSREAALAALQDSELTWEIVYTSPSLTGVRAAALAGLAITALPESAVIAGLRILDAEAGLPRLPDLEFAIYEKPRADKAAAALAAALLALAQGPLRPTI